MEFFGKFILCSDNEDCPVIIEGGVSWLHFDVLPQTGIMQKVYEFKA